MLVKLALFGCSAWFTYFVLRLLLVAKVSGYVMARGKPSLSMTADPNNPEVPVFRRAQPTNFWANVIVALCLLPLAITGLFVAGLELWAALLQMGI